MYYSLVGILALIILLIVNYDTFFYGQGTTKMRGFWSYRFFVASLALFFICDFLWGIFDQLALAQAAFVDTSFYFIAMSLSVLAWARFAVAYLGEKKLFGKALLLLGWSFFLTGVIMIIANFFYPIVFSYDSTVYVPVAARNAYLIAQIAIFFLTSVYAFVQVMLTKGFECRRYIAMLAFGLVLSVAIGFQFAYPLYPFYSVGAISGAVLLHVFVVAAEKRQYRLAIEEGKTRESKQQEELGSAKTLAYLDSLTGANSRHAYVEREVKMDELIREDKIGDFAVVIFDLNDLKTINDTKGHEAGDLYLKASADLICEYFPDTPLYRFGGDEFAMILEGEAYETRQSVLGSFNERIDRNLGTGEPIVATGISEYRKGEDNTLRAVFSRADDAMYIRKRKLKQFNGAKYGARDDIYEMFYRSKDCSLADMLNNSSCDVIAEVNLKRDTIQYFFHVEGKYLFPEKEISYQELHQFVLDYLVHPEDKESFLRLMEPDRFFERIAKNKIPNFDFGHFRYKLQDGGYHYVEQCVLAGEENEVAAGTFRIYLFDINNLKVRQEGIESNRFQPLTKSHDSMTGLLNNTAFFAAAQEKVNESKDVFWCLIALDIEHFKFFNEWYGREVGDRLLAQIGAVLRDYEQRYNGVAGFFGHDDFALMMPYRKEDIDELYEDIRRMTVSFGLSVGFLPSFGVAMIEGEMRVADAFDRANIAQSRAKRDLRNRIATYDATVRESTADEYRILGEFITAIKNDEFTFYVQPQVRLSSGKTVGGEALVRWIKANGSIVMPGDYIPVLEKYGFIMDLDECLWEKVAKWLRSLLDEGMQPVPVSLNVSRADIVTIDIASHFHKLAEKYNLPHELIKIEITESAYAETTDSIKQLVEDLRNDGFAVFMDDFGSGYSSLNMLSTLKVDAIKLDAAFLNLGEEEYEKGIRILESVVNMTKILGLPIIVEGVETQEHSEFLQSLGCRYAQGYFFYRPMKIEAFEDLLKNEENIDRRGLVMKTNEQFRIREFLDENVYSDSMLNSILGAVVIYALREEGAVEIVRFNQQFYQLLAIQDLSSNMKDVGKHMIPKQKEKLIAALHKAMENRLTGSTEILSFYMPNGNIASFRMHFYHIGTKEDGERFYTSCIDVTELIDLSEEMRLLGEYSEDNLIFVKKEEDRWVYNVASHGLADIVGLSPKELEAEMNDGRFAKRVKGREQLADFMKKAGVLAGKHEDFSKEFTIKTKDGNEVRIELSFTYVGDEVNNIVYVLRSKLL